MANIYNSQLDAFTLYHKVQESHNSSSPLLDSSTILPSLSHALTGSTGAAISNVITYPLDLIITRLQVQRQLRKDQSVASDDECTDLQDAIHKIYTREGGLRGFYVGLWPDTAKTVVDAFLFFLLYSFFRQRRLALRGANGLRALDELSVGFGAGALTKLVTTPIANVVVRKQTSTSRNAAPGPSSGISSTAIARDIYNHQGLPGFWSGYSASLILTLNPSITFFLFETLQKLFLPKSRRSNPPGWAVFLMAAVSKSAANSVTYPFSLAKARAQSGAKSEQQDEKIQKRVKGRATVFTTLQYILRTEGLPSLYSGLSLELLKGFLSHGITMAVKQTLQHFILRVYSVLSLLYARYKSQATASPTRLAEQATQRGYEYYDLALARVREKAEEAKKAVLQGANETAELVAEYVDEDGDGGAEWRDRYEGAVGLARWLGEK